MIFNCAADANVSLNARTCAKHSAADAINARLGDHFVICGRFNGEKKKNFEIKSRAALSAECARIYNRTASREGENALVYIIEPVRVHAVRAGGRARRRFLE